jgi:uncharacterized protein YcsI (UPF0317 family)
VRTDVPRYRVYRGGAVVEEPTDLHNVWQDDLVSFLLGCSFSFEEALLAGGLRVRHLEHHCNVPMYVTNVQCAPVGPFAGPLVVTMRPFPAGQVARATEISARFPFAHGAPVHAGDPAALGIRSLAQPDYGDAVQIGRVRYPSSGLAG